MEHCANVLNASCALVDHHDHDQRSTAIPEVILVDDDEMGTDHMFDPCPESIYGNTLNSVSFVFQLILHDPSYHPSECGNKVCFRYCDPLTSGKQHPSRTRLLVHNPM